MNPRFRDLQIEAFAQCKTFEDGSMIKTDDAFQKFGELIVRECTNIVLTTEIENNDNAKLRGEIVVRFKKHFGVE